MGSVVGIALLFLIAGSNIWATHRVLNDVLSERKQKLFQLLIVWLVPFMGAMLVYVITRQNLPRGSGIYQRENAEIDDYAGMRGRGKSSAMESDDASSDS